MKGKLTALAVIAALAVPAAADSATRELNGRIDGGGRITIGVKTPKGDPQQVSVGKIRIRRIVVRCEGTDNRLTFSIRGGAPINDERRFRIRATDSQGGKSRIKGRFNRRFTRVRGRIRVFGRFQAEGGGTLSCDSGRERFRAR